MLQERGLGEEVAIITARDCECGALGHEDGNRDSGEECVTEAWPDQY